MNKFKKYVMLLKKLTFKEIYDTILIKEKAEISLQIIKSK